MFSKSIENQLFRELKKGLFGYSGKMDFPGHENIEVTIKGRSDSALSIAVEELQFIKNNLKQFLTPATEEAFDGYDNIRDAINSGEFDLESEGGKLPEIETAQDVWAHMNLETIVVESNKKNQVRLGFRCPWDIEHDFGIYITSKKYEFSGISV